MKLIVCLGNIGKEYNNTRHNVGFMIADYMESNYVLETKFRCYMYQGILENEKYMIIKPTTYMNESGLSVLKIASYYNIEPENILVIQDDMDLPLGSYKLKRNSSSGGHNGIKSIINGLHTDTFLRLKVGIGHALKNETIDYVLGKFSKTELALLTKNFAWYKEIVDCFIKNDIITVLQNYSKK